MRTVFAGLLVLVCSASAASGSDSTAPMLVLSSEGTSDARADYAAVSLRLGGVALSFGRPRSALDDVSPFGPALSMLQSRSRAGEAAQADQLGAGMLLEGEPTEGLSLSTSIHDGEQSNAYVAISGKYTAPDVAPIGQIVIYGGTESSDTADVYRLGSSLTRGRTSAGVDFAAEESPSQRRVTGIYVGLDVTETFSFAVSREIERSRDGEELPARLGLGAAYSLGDRQVISGAIGDMTGETPSFGLMLGLEF